MPYHPKGTALYLKERERQEMLKGYQEMAALNKEIYLADLDSVRGHEQARTRPVLIIQNDIRPLRKSGRGDSTPPKRRWTRH